MNLRILFLIVMCFFSSWSYAQTADQRVEELIEKGDWFSLDEEYPVLKDSIQSPVLKGMSEMLLKVYFNQLPDVMENIQFLINNYQSELEGEVVDVVGYSCKMLARMGYYADASDQMRDLVNQLSQFVPKEQLTDRITFADFYNAARHIQPYYLRRSDQDVVVPFTLVKVGRGNLMSISVNIYGKDYKFLFDTGASVMGLSQKLVNEIGLKILVDSVPVSGSTGNRLSQLTMIDSLRINKMRYLNPLAWIIPPDAEIDSVYQFDGVIGADFMNLVGEVQIFPKENKLVFPVQFTETPSTGRNMIVNEGLYYVKGYSGNERLKMVIDCGSVSSELFPFFYEKHRTEIDQRAIKDTISMGGIGGYKKCPILRLDAIPFRIGENASPLQSINVISEQKEVYSMDTDGLLGLDFFLSFSKVTINFRKMFLKVE